MSHATSIGQCPKCTAPIPDYNLLIEYEAEGRHERFAECPSCEDVVHPA